MRRRSTPLHDFWHPRVEGQIRDAMYHHPEWFNFKSDRSRRDCVNSLAKRIVGEIVAWLLTERNATRAARVVDVLLKDASDSRLPAPGEIGGSFGLPISLTLNLETIEAISGLIGYVQSLENFPTWEIRDAWRTRALERANQCQKMLNKALEKAA